VPVQFLSQEQARRYGTFHGNPTPQQLHRFFEPGRAERADIDRQRSDRSRLGFAVQLGCVRFLGCFPDLSAPCTQWQCC
jgi:TnpA family transposase